MNIAVTGATGFLGRYIVNRLSEAGHQCRCWHRPSSDRSALSDATSVTWCTGSLEKAESMTPLVEGCDAVVHAALHKPGRMFRGGEGDVATFVETNVLGSIRLIEAARKANVPRFIFISTCAVHEVILSDRPLDEAHPLWASSHYGAHKAAIEKFVHSYGLSQGYDICALRPTGIYGIEQTPQASKWFDLVQAVKRGENISSAKGGKEVHAADVAKAVEILLTADGIAGQAYNCYDQYISQELVATIAKEISASTSEIARLNEGPKNQIVTEKLQKLGMRFGGETLLRQTIQELLACPT